MIFSMIRHTYPTYSLEQTNGKQYSKASYSCEIGSQQRENGH